MNIQRETAALTSDASPKYDLQWGAEWIGFVTGANCSSNFTTLFFFFRYQRCGLVELGYHSTIIWQSAIALRDDFVSRAKDFFLPSPSLSFTLTFVRYGIKRKRI